MARYQVDRPTVDYASAADSIPRLRRAAPTKIGRYTMLDLLGVGGMGVVCTAYDPKLDRKVALKLLRKKKEGDHRLSTGQARLIREAQALAKLSHPNIVTVHDVDTYDGQIYMAMEYVDGLSLDQWMVRAERAWRDVVPVFIEAARGLAAAHDAGITHRDFKPANVLIGKDGRVLVVDFGLAKSNDHDIDKSEESPPSGHSSGSDDHESNLMEVIGSTVDTKLTQVGRTVGTPAYMAPEQFLGLEVGPETDQFSFGVALYEALYGYLPFPDESREELIDRVTEGRVNEIPRDTPVPGWVHRVVLRALQARPELRYPSMNALITALQADPARRRRRGMAAAAAVVLGGLAVYGASRGFTQDRNVCTGAQAQADEVWNPGRKATVRTSFEAIAFPYAVDTWQRVEEQLDEHVEQWVTDHTAICEATNVRKEQSSGLMDTRMACLERRRGELRALVEVFSMADDAVVLQAVEAVQSLEDSSDCRTVMESRGLSVDDPALEAQAAEVEALLARSKAMALAARPEAAMKQAASALRQARELGHRPTLARAALNHAKIATDLSQDVAAVRDQLVEAIGLAAETEQADLEVMGWTRLIVLDGTQRGQPEAALAFKLPATLALRRAAEPSFDAALEQAVGSVLSARGDYDAALSAQLRALDKYRTAHGSQHYQVATVLSNVGAAFAQLQRNDDAQRYLSEAAEMTKRLYGSHHPLLGSIYNNLGGLLQRSGNPKAAHDAYLRATKVCQKALLPGHRRTLRAMLGLAQTEVYVNPSLAHKRFDDLLTVIRAQDEPHLPVMGSTYNSLGRLQRAQAITAEAEGDLGRTQDLRRKAFESFSAALATFSQIEGEARPVQALQQIRLTTCALERLRGHLPVAAEHCEAAWALQQELGQLGTIGIEVLSEVAHTRDATGRRAEAEALLREQIAIMPIRPMAVPRLDLADLLWRVRSTRAEAVELVKQTQLALRQEAQDDAKREQVERWLREHTL